MGHVLKRTPLRQPNRPSPLRIRNAAGHPGWAPFGLVAALLCAVPFQAAAELAPDQQEALTGGGPASGLPAKVRDGDILASSRPHPKTDVRWGHAIGIVDAPVEEVMKIVSDYAAYPDFMPHFKVSRVLAQRGAQALVYMEALIAKGTMTVWAQLKIRPKNQDETQMVVASMTKGNLDHMEARWEVRALDPGRSLVTFEILVDPKLPLPSSLVSGENEKAARRTIKALRKRLTQTRPAQ